MEQTSKKHSYGGRTCMACGGMSCKISYEQLRDMVEKKQNGDFYAKGGTVAQGEDALEVKGIHAGVPTRDTAGEDKSHAVSWAGHGIRHNNGKSKVAKEEHHRVLGEMKSMPKPHGNYADGGLAHDPSKYNEDGSRKAGVTPPAPSPTPQGENETRVKSQLAGAFGHAEGGEIEDDASDGDHDMMMDQCAHECMEAMKSGDKAMFKDALYTLMADMMSKMGKDE